MSADPKDIQREQLVSLKIDGNTYFGGVDETDVGAFFFFYT